MTTQETASTTDAHHAAKAVWDAVGVLQGTLTGAPKEVLSVTNTLVHYAAEALRLLGEVKS